MLSLPYRAGFLPVFEANLYVHTFMTSADDSTQLAGKEQRVSDISLRDHGKAPSPNHQELEDVELGNSDYEPGPGELRKKQVINSLPCKIAYF